MSLNSKQGKENASKQADDMICATVIDFAMHGDSNGKLCVYEGGGGGICWSPFFFAVRCAVHRQCVKLLRLKPALV